MIYVTGDIHASIDIGKLSTKRFPQQKTLSKDDYLIVCGDFGLVWNNSNSDLYWRKWLADKPFTTLWVDGNHENFDLLYQFPLTDKFFGKVREIAPSIYHLDRGQVLTINDKLFFVMGGASSHDKEFRKEHISWWKEEMPTAEEMQRSVDALEANHWAVDYVITHCAPASVQRMVSNGYEEDPLVRFFEMISSKLSFKNWFFGHYHMDKQFTPKFIALYNNIITIDSL